jgi:hypothetical protein
MHGCNHYTVNGTTMPRHKTIKFDVVPLDQVPSRNPIARPSSNPCGSQWDEVLKTLERRPGFAVRIMEHDDRERNRLKSTLQTIAKNRGFFVEVRSDSTFVYAWSSEKVGRFAPPGGC